MQAALAGIGGLMRRRLLAISALSLPAMLSLLVLWVKHTDAYGQAERFVHQDARVANLIGKVDRVDFLFWHSFLYLGDDAVFSFRATNGKGSYIIDVNLRQIVGKWRVKEGDISPQDSGDTFLIFN